MSPNTAASRLPLKTLWKTELSDWRVKHTPLLHGNRVVVRGDNQVVALDAATGRMLWGTEVDPKPLVGEFLMTCGGLIVTDQFREPDHLSSLVALDWEGKQAWMCELPISVQRDRSLCDERGLLLVGSTPSHDAWLLMELAPQTGTLRSTHPLKWPADSLALLDDGLVAACRNVDEQVGLYRMSRDGSKPSPLGQAPVERLLRTERTMLSLGTLIEARDLATLEVRWSAPASEAGLGAEGGEVVHVMGKGKKRALVLRDETTGAERWRASPPPSEALHAYFAGAMVLVRDMDGLGVWRRRDGAFLGYEEDIFSIRGAVRGEHLYLGHGNEVLCLSIAD